MKLTILSFLSLFLLAVASEQYIVVLKSPTTSSELRDHIGNFGPDRVTNIFDMKYFKGYSANLRNTDLETLSADPTVNYVERDQIVTIRAKRDVCLVQKEAVWNLDRIIARQVNLTGLYIYNHQAGFEVDAYVIDTGIYTGHDEFSGRATFGANFIDSKNEDCNGHGTHVAGTIGGEKFGVAKSVQLIAVKVLDCNGAGTYTSVLKGIEWVTQQSRNSTRKTVANMSLGGGKSQALNDAVDASVREGVTHVVAGGNSDTKSCLFSPASAESAITIGSTSIQSTDDGVQFDARSHFSNWGECIDLFAPGSLITSAWIGSPDATNTISGTSMASPHVAGVAALILGEVPDITPEGVRKYLVKRSTRDAIKMECQTEECSKTTPNLFVYSSC